MGDGLLYEQLAGELSRLISEGVLACGDRLPSVRRLAEERRLSVSTRSQFDRPSASTVPSLAVMTNSRSARKRFIACTRVATVTRWPNDGRAYIETSHFRSIHPQWLAS